jgi:uncharacterized membrane protein YkvA (DUF1232 family)
MSAPEEPRQPEELDEGAFGRKLRRVPGTIVEKALTLYVILTDGATPVWARALVLAAITYLINPFDAIPDALPGIGLADDLAVLALALERLSRFVTPGVEARVKELSPSWMSDASGDDESQPTEKPEIKTKARTRRRSKKKGGADAPNQEDKEDPDRRSRVPFIERFRILP